MRSVRTHYRLISSLRFSVNNRLDDATTTIPAHDVFVRVFRPGFCFFFFLRFPFFRRTIACKAERVYRTRRDPTVCRAAADGRTSKRNTCARVSRRTVRCSVGRDSMGAQHTVFPRHESTTSHRTDIIYTGCGRPPYSILISQSNQTGLKLFASTCDDITTSSSSSCTGTRIDFSLEFRRTLLSTLYSYGLDRGSPTSRSSYKYWSVVSKINFIINGRSRNNSVGS